MDVEDAVAAGWAAANREDPAPTIAYFAELLDRDPASPRLLYEAACSQDFGGRPVEAAALYERAVAAGLSGDLLRRGLLQYGSTLRNLGRTEEAVAALRHADREFPGNDAVQAYLALALVSVGESGQAVATLLDLVLNKVDSDDLRRYEWALRRYAAALRS